MDNPWIVLHPMRANWEEAYILVNLDRVLVISPMADTDTGSQVTFDSGKQIDVIESPREIVSLPRRAHTARKE